MDFGSSLAYRAVLQPCLFHMAREWENERLGRRQKNGLRFFLFMKKITGPISSGFVFLEYKDVVKCCFNCHVFDSSLFSLFFSWTLLCFKDFICWRVKLLFLFNKLWFTSLWFSPHPHFFIDCHAINLFQELSVLFCFIFLLVMIFLTTY